MKPSFFHFKSLFVFSIFIAGLSAGCTRQQNSGTTPTLTMGLSADYPPFEFKKNGEIVGFDVDIARAIAQELGYGLTIQDMDFSALIPSLQSGRVDFAMAGMTVTEERKKNVSFSDSYFTSSFALILPKEASFHEDSDFQGKKVGAQLGSTMEKLAREKAKVQAGMEVVALAKNPVMIQEIKANRLFGLIVEDVQAVSFVQANPSLKFAKMESTGDGYAIAFPPSGEKSAQLKEDFNRVLKKLKESGRLAQIQSKWMEK